MKERNVRKEVKCKEKYGLQGIEGWEEETQGVTSLVTFSSSVFRISNKDEED